jgi:glucose/arabinose dehydrogenase
MVVPACSAPADDGGSEDSDATDEGALSYATAGTCDGLPRIENLETPPGVCVGLVATGFTYARGIAQLPSDDLVLAEMGGWAQDRGAVWILHRNADRTYTKKRIVSKIDKPSGVAIGPDGLPYVGTPTNIFRFDPTKIEPNLGQPRLKVVVKDLPGDGRHPLKRFVFDKRSPWTVYVNVGSGTDVCEQGPGAKPPAGFPFPCAEAEGDAPRGGLRKYELGGADHVATGFTPLARGLRNSMALVVHPTSGVLVQAENSRDSINKIDASLTAQEGDLPHEELNVIQEGAHYGWPYCIDNGVPNPEYRGRVDCANYTNPALMLPGHVSPLGMAYYTGQMFPAPYQGNLLVTFHGYREYGHRLVMVPVDANGVPGAGEPLDVIRGWEKNAKGPMGAPVDVMVARDGSIFVTEDKNGTVLRVFFDPSGGSGAPMRPVPVTKPVVSADEQARCEALAAKNDAFSILQKSVFDVSCAGCHGAGPGYAGGLALVKCDAAGNWKRLTQARTGGRDPYVVPGNEESELVLRLRGRGFPLMPAGGLEAERLDEVVNWVRSGAPGPE